MKIDPDSCVDTHTFYLCDGYQEDSYEVEYQYSLPIPGRIDGPPDVCYEDSGGEAEVTGEVLFKSGCKGPGVCVDYEDFVLQYVKYHNLKDVFQAEIQICDALSRAGMYSQRDN